MSQSFPYKTKTKPAPKAKTKPKAAPRKKPAPVDPTIVRCTLSLPSAMFRDLTSVATGLRVSRSALVVQIAQDALFEMARDLEELADYGEPGEVARRLRGKSVELVEQAYREFVSDTFEMGEGEGMVQ